MQTMAEAGKEFSIANENGEVDYRVELSEGDYLFVTASMAYGSSAAKFDSAKILHTQKRILNFKHYSRNRKWWTERPGIDIVFAIPKSKIYMLPEKGYSYVPIEIGGVKFHLNVSGGTSKQGWTDYVSQGCSIGVFAAKKNLKVLSNNAEIPSGISSMFDSWRAMDENEMKKYNKLCAFYDAKDKLKIGDKIVLDCYCSFQDSQGPFSISRKPPRKHSFICVANDSYASSFLVKYKNIDWLETAKVNDIPVAV